MDNLKIILIPFVVCMYAANFHAQNIEHRDSVAIGHNSMRQIDLIQKMNLSSSRVGMLPNNPIEMPEAFVIESVLQKKSFLTKKDLYVFSPYSYSSGNYYEYIILKGINVNFPITDFLSINTNVYLSRSYFGNIQPNSYINGSIRTDLIFKLHDRFQLVGIGHVSVREGLDPNLPSLIGGANYFGVGAQFKVTNKIGIGVGVTNNYYRGEWTKRTYAVPVGY